MEQRTVFIWRGAGQCFHCLQHNLMIRKERFTVRCPGSFVRKRIRQIQHRIFRARRHRDGAACADSGIAFHRRGDHGTAILDPQHTACAAHCCNRRIAGCPFHLLHLCIEGQHGGGKLKGVLFAERCAPVVQGNALRLGRILPGQFLFHQAHVVHIYSIGTVARLFKIDLDFRLVCGSCIFHLVARPHASRRFRHNHAVAAVHTECQLLARLNLGPRSERVRRIRLHGNRFGQFAAAAGCGFVPFPCGFLPVCFRGGRALRSGCGFDLRRRLFLRAGRGWRDLHVIVAQPACAVAQILPHADFARCRGCVLGFHLQFSVYIPLQAFAFHFDADLILLSGNHLHRARGCVQALVAGAHTPRNLIGRAHTRAPGSVREEKIRFRRHIPRHHAQLLGTGVRVQDLQGRFIHCILVIFARIQNAALIRCVGSASQLQRAVFDLKLRGGKRIAAPGAQIPAGKILEQGLCLYRLVAACQLRASITRARIAVIHLDGVVPGARRCLCHRAADRPSCKPAGLESGVLHQICIARLRHRGGHLRHSRRRVQAASCRPIPGSIFICAQIRAGADISVVNARDDLRHVDGGRLGCQGVFMGRRVRKTGVRPLQVAVRDSFRLKANVSNHQVVHHTASPCVLFEHPGEILVDVPDQGVVIRRDIVAGHIELERRACIPHNVVMYQPVAGAVVQVDAGFAARRIIVVEPVVADFRSAAVCGNCVEYAQIGTDHPAVGKIVVFNFAALAGLEDDDIPTGVVGGVVADDISVAADVDARPIAADVIRVVDAAVEQQVVVAAEPHARGGAVGHFAVGNDIVVAEQLDTGNICSVGVHNFGGMGRIAGVHAVQRDVAGAGAGDGGSQHMDALDIHIRRIVQVDRRFTRFHLNRFACGVSVEVQFPLRLVVIPFVFTVQRTVNIGQVIGISFGGGVLHIRQTQRREGDGAARVILHGSGLAGPSAARVDPQRCALEKSVAERFERRVGDSGVASALHLGEAFVKLAGLRVRPAGVKAHVSIHEHLILVAQRQHRVCHIDLTLVPFKAGHLVGSADDHRFAVVCPERDGRSFHAGARLQRFVIGAAPHNTGIARLHRLGCLAQCFPRRAGRTVVRVASRRGNIICLPARRRRIRRRCKAEHTGGKHCRQGKREKALFPHDAFSSVLFEYFSNSQTGARRTAWPRP